MQRHRDEMGEQLRKTIPLLAATLMSSLLAFATDAEAKTSRQTWYKSTSKGRSFVVSEHWDVNRDCSLRAYPSAKVVLPPKHGKTKIGRGRFKIGGKLAKDPYYQCKSLRVSGVQILYTPQPGFTGKDVLKVRVAYGTGDIHEIDIVVTVR